METKGLTTLSPLAFVSAHPRPRSIVELAYFWRCSIEKLFEVWKGSLLFVVNPRLAPDPSFLTTNPRE